MISKRCWSANPSNLLESIKTRDAKNVPMLDSEDSIVLQGSGVTPRTSPIKRPMNVARNCSGHFQLDRSPCFRNICEPDVVCEIRKMLDGLDVVRRSLVLIATHLSSYCNAKDRHTSVYTSTGSHGCRSRNRWSPVGSRLNESKLRWHHRSPEFPCIEVKAG